MNATDQKGRTALFAAAEEGNVEVVQAFLSHGVDVNAIDQDGWNALFAAAEEGNVEVVQALVNCGVDVNVTDQVVCVCVFVCVCVGGGGGMGVVGGGAHGIFISMENHMCTGTMTYLSFDLIKTMAGDSPIF